MMKRLSVMLCPLLVVSGCDSIEKAKELAKQEDAKWKSGSVTVEGGNVHKLTADGYDEFIGQGGALVVVDFYADWCGPCKRLAPIMDKMAAEFGDRVVVGKLDVDQYGEVAQRIGVSGIPDVRFFLDGKQVDRIVGLPPESELRARMERLSKGVVARPKEEKKAESDLGPEKPKEPTIQPMGKDWIPPGMQKK